MQLLIFDRRLCNLREASFAISMLALVAGCREETSTPDTVPVMGEVTLDGAPVHQADVSFTPTADSSEATPAQAVTDEAGRFEVISLFDGGRTDKPGLQPGRYAVTVTQLEQPLRDAKLSRAPRNLLPEKYAAATTSGLSIEVLPEEDNHFVLKLSK